MTTKTPSDLSPSLVNLLADHHALLPRLEQISGKLETFEAKLESLHLLLSSRRKDFYTVEEIAEVIGRSPYTIRRWITEHKLAATRVQGTGPRGKLLIARTELDKLIASGLGANVPDAIVGDDSLRT